MPVDFGPPSNLDGFPTRTLAAGLSLYRVHHANLGPCWFSSFPLDHPGGGRFDLPAPDGTSYWALKPEAAFLETIVRSPITIVPLELLDRYQLSKGELPAPLEAANSPVKRARSFGLTAEFHTTTDYQLTRRWAHRLAASGRRALISIPRHDVTARLRSVALFGKAGEHRPFRKSWRLDTSPIPSSLIEAMTHWGIRCLPIPFDVPTVDP